MLTSCARRETIIGADGQEPKFGSYSRAEVDVLRASLDKLTFPVPEHTVARMLPHPVKSLPMRFVDYAHDQENKGRMGGNVVEYWLNRESALQVATAYYSVGESHWSREEWAVVLSREERKSFSRPIYPSVLARIPK